MVFDVGRQKDVEMEMGMVKIEKSEGLVYENNKGGHFGLKKM